MKRIILLYLVVICLGTACQKFLDKKSDQNLATPQTLADLQALADNPSLSISTRIVNNLTDEYYISYDYWQAIEEQDRDSYVWDANLNNYEDWITMYNHVLYCNTILDNIDKVEDAANTSVSNPIKGSALFLRSFYFYKVAELYAPAFDATTNKTDWGIPLRLDADFNLPASRATIEATYKQIINDLQTAADLLKNNKPTSQLNKTRPSITACYGMLARVYLQTGDFEKALEYASLCIASYDKLMDYNDASQVDTSSLTPIKKFNQEVILYAAVQYPITSGSEAIIDSNLYSSFDDNDLRKKVYFELNPDETPWFKGSYNGSIDNLFQGIAVDEVYLAKAEAAARTGNANLAMTSLNSLLSKRYRTGTYIPYTGLQPDEILSIILTERKKELLYRGTRWSDLRRLNKTPAFATTIKRKLNDQLITLPPGDLRYTLLIPIEVINKSSMPQNKR
jgi:starch-binding outer membrane protein, SusD/RagB family